MIVVTADANKNPPTCRRTVQNKTCGSLFLRHVKPRLTYGTGIADAPPEAAAAGGALLDAEDVAASQLTADAEPLHHAEDDEADRRRGAPGAVGGQQPHEDRGNRDEEDREHERVLPAHQAVPHLPEHDRPERPHEERREVDPEGIDQLQLLGRLWKEAAADFGR